MLKKKLFLSLLLMSLVGLLQGQSGSIARYWMQTFLYAVTQDAPRPTIHARNMYHIALAMHEAWAAFEKDTPQLMLGTTYQGFSCPCELPDFQHLSKDSLENARREAISYAAFRLIFLRFNEYHSKNRNLESVMDSMAALGYGISLDDLDFQRGKPAALGNYIADCVIRFGLEDGSRESGDHENTFYQPYNPRLRPDQPANPTLRYPNHWQPLYLRPYLAIKGADASLPDWAHTLLSTHDEFLSAEWGYVKPFALAEADKAIYVRRRNAYPVYLDPGPPPYYALGAADTAARRAYLDSFLPVLLGSAHLDPADGVTQDISPAHVLNPHTKKVYAPHFVKRGDYMRVAIEYWDGGLHTVSLPGMWLEKLFDVTDHPDFRRKWGGKGREMDLLEWEVKSYLLMGAAMHDAAIAAWSVKGWYDYIRPISVIRWMAGSGQCSDSTLPHYHRFGLPPDSGPH